MKNGNERNFYGTTVNVTGPDDLLEKLIDELEYTSGAEVLSRRAPDENVNTGMLVIGAARFARVKVCSMAQKLGLAFAY